MTREENEYIIKTLESKVEKLQEDLRNKRISIKNKKAKIKELEQKLEQTEKDLADYQFNYPKIKELEKENAELKSLTDFQIWSNIDNYSLLKRSKEQLTKATEILKEFCTYRMYDCDATREDGTYEAFEGLRKQAEQFLQEETK